MPRRATNFNSSWENFMSLDYALGGILAIALAVFLVYALVKPERF